MDISSPTPKISKLFSISIWINLFFCIKQFKGDSDSITVLVMKSAIPCGFEHPLMMSRSMDCTTAFLKTQFAIAPSVSQTFPPQWAEVYTKHVIFSNKVRGNRPHSPIRVIQGPYQPCITFGACGNVFVEMWTKLNEIGASWGATSFQEATVAHEVFCNVDVSPPSQNPRKI